MLLPILLAAGAIALLVTRQKSSCGWPPKADQYARYKGYYYQLVIHPNDGAITIAGYGPGAISADVFVAPCTKKTVGAAPTKGGGIFGRDPARDEADGIARAWIDRAPPPPYPPAEGDVRG